MSEKDNVRLRKNKSKKWYGNKKWQGKNKENANKQPRQRFTQPTEESLAALKNHFNNK